MSYTTAGITILSDSEYDLGRVIRVASANGTMAVQCYVSGVLTQTAQPVGGVATFDLNGTSAQDVLFFLASDDDADHFTQAFPTDASHGNRITVTVPITSGYRAGDRISVAIDGATVYAGPCFPADAGLMGFGLHYGESYGYGGGAGWGYGFGLQYGLGCRVASVQSAPLVTGAHTVVTTISDEAGNSTDDTQTVTLSTFPRPATSLAVSSYTLASDSLALAWTASPDL